MVSGEMGKKVNFPHRWKNNRKRFFHCTRPMVENRKHWRRQFEFENSPIGLRKEGPLDKLEVTLLDYSLTSTSSPAASTSLGSLGINSGRRCRLRDLRPLNYKAN